MKLEKLFGSKAKVDIIKYLLFRRQGVSMRALEAELEWTFPAIKKQIDSMEEAEVITIEKDSTKWSIQIKKDFHENIKNIFIYCLDHDIKALFETYEILIDKYFLGKVFWKEMDMDIVVIYKNCEAEALEKIKQELWQVFRNFMIENPSAVFMSADEFQKRYRLADKFVLNIMRTV